MKFVVACKKYFGMKPGQTLKDFGAEVRAVPEKDKAELAKLLSVELGKTIEV